MLKLCSSAMSAAAWLTVAGLCHMAPAHADDLLTTDSFVVHKSTVPANEGQEVGLFLREKVLASVQQDIQSHKSPPKVVLFVHGGFSPSNVAYDLDYKDYSWMANLARAGFDVFAMTQTAYGASPKPMMDDPCNVVPEQQKLLIPQVLSAPCKPHYPFKLVSSQTEWDEVADVVEHIRAMRGVARISFVGWSTGTPRIGGFAATHPDEVDRIVFLAPAPFFENEAAPETLPEPGAPIILQTRERLEKERWLADVHCVPVTDQIDDDTVRDVMWKALMAEEGAGATWMPGGVMRAPNRMNFGWRTNVAKIKAPTLVMLGEFDNYQNRFATWKAITAEQRAFIKVSCGSHYLIYEKNRSVLHKAAIEWLNSGTIEGRDRGLFTAARDGSIVADGS